MTYASNFAVFSLSYALSFGFVAGFAYMVSIHHSWLWFPKHGGLTSGLIIGSFGIGTIVFNEVAHIIVNPDNIQAVDGVFPPEVTANVPKML
jgi:hypothetical protein